MPREVFVAGQVLTAAELNVVSDQSVMVFAGTAARGSAIPSPTEGMVTYRSDDDSVEVYDGSSWSAVAGGKILQVVTVTKTDTFSASLGANTWSSNVTGLDVSITPSSASSKILITGAITGARSGDYPILAVRLMRDSTPIAQPASPGSRVATSTSQIIVTASGQNMVTASLNYVDSPATTSAITYGIQLHGVSASTGTTVYVNRSSGDGDSANQARGVSTITLMEVAV